ncbi:MAG: deoxynucleoside kinase [Trueperaceae bacterium]|nr:deoxynucleoside kinase [Trueperaceae bacterium]
MSFIAVEGPIGVGKTSLCNLLSQELNGRTVLEVVEENPFLAPFYEDPKGYAFKVQVFFLLSRYKQLQELSQGSLFAQHTVSDYMFDKDFIFASMNLKGHEWELYKELYTQLSPKLSQPDLVIYLRAQPDLLFERIAKRQRKFEQGIEASYLEQLNAAYDDYFSHYQGPLHIIEASHYDFVENADDRLEVLHQVLHFASAA